ncbi:MAG TPA: hypothetical protein PKH69_06235 [Thiobacillaceae bacterium]|nr:hypothetical protein [Thiobacillaceae bacterium]HNU65357.1 hypothetical protein [Thiobacillaceae bacterium]
MTRKKQTTLSLALGSALSASLASTPAAAVHPGNPDNPFASRVLDKGYMVAQAEGQQAGGKAGQNSGPDEAANRRMMREGKCGEGKCGAKNAKEGKCGNTKNMTGKPAAGKNSEGRCGSRKPADKNSEGLCGSRKPVDKNSEGRCGSRK